MRIAVFSDIHGNYEALKSILNDIEKNNIDITIFLGDAISLGPNSEECIKLLTEKNIIYLYGNHELYLEKGCNIDPYIKKENIEHCKYIESLNLEKYIKNIYLKKEITFNNKKILFTHYFQVEDEYPFHSLSIVNDKNFNSIIDNYNYDYIFYGHEHKEDIKTINNTKLYGIGSSGCVKDDNTYYYVIDLNNNISIKKVTIKYNRNKLINSFNTKKYPQKDLIAYKLFNIK